MGRTQQTFDDEEDRRKIQKRVKHSRNLPGKGMRVINSWSEEFQEEDDDELDYEYDAYTSQTQRT